MDARTRSSFRRLRRATVLLLPAVAFLLAAGCEKPPARTQLSPPGVTVSRPVRENVTDRLRLTGNIQAVNTVQLRARVEGYLEKVLFKDGDMVRKGQLLFVIQQDTYIAKLQQAEGNVRAQKALLEHARTEFNRYSALYAQKAAAQTDVENWRYQVDAATAGLLSAEAQRDLAKLDLDYTSVVAPFNGRMDRRLVDPGNLVGAGENTILAQITEMDPLYVYFTVSETQMLPLIGKSADAVAQGSGSRNPVTMQLAEEEGYSHKGYLDFSATNVSTSTGTLLVRAVFPNPDEKMRPGQFARVRVPVNSARNAILVPRVSVGYDELGAYVLTVNDQNVVERRSVKTETSRGDLYVIEDGLKGDERVVVKGLLKAMPGRTVTPEPDVSVNEPAGPVASASSGRTQTP